MSEYVWIDVDPQEGAETEKALRFSTEVGSLWIPKSQIGARKKVAGKITRIEVTTWWAEKEGLHDPKDSK